MLARKVKVNFRNEAGNLVQCAFVVFAPKYKPVKEVISAEFILDGYEIESVEELDSHVGFVMQIEGEPFSRCVGGRSNVSKL